MKAFFTLFVTEIKLSLRYGDMILFGILMPVGIMLLIGCVSSREATALAFSGVASVGLCASGLMGIPLTFATYRHDKILRRFRVTPASPLVLMLAVAAVQTLFAWVSLTLVYLVARLAFGVTVAGPGAAFLGTFAFVQLSIYSIGFLVASLAPNVKAANVACTVLYFPTLFLSGTTVPYEILPAPVRSFAGWFPLTEGIKLLKAVATGSSEPTLAGFLALAALAVVSYLLSLKFFRWE
jgi:ABC-2 type transport system permease protein